MTTANNVKNNEVKFSDQEIKDLYIQLINLIIYIINLDDEKNLFSYKKLNKLNHYLKKLSKLSPEDKELKNMSKELIQKFDKYVKNIIPKKDWEEIIVNLKAIRTHILELQEKTSLPLNINTVISNKNNESITEHHETLHESNTSPIQLVSQPALITPLPSQPPTTSVSTKAVLASPVLSNVRVTLGEALPNNLTHPKKFTEGETGLAKIITKAYWEFEQLKLPVGAVIPPVAHDNINQIISKAQTTINKFVTAGTLKNIEGTPVAGNVTYKHNTIDLVRQTYNEVTNQLDFIIDPSFTGAITIDRLDDKGKPIPGKHDILYYRAAKPQAKLVGVLLAQNKADEKPLAETNCRVYNVINAHFMAEGNLKLTDPGIYNCRSHELKENIRRYGEHRIEKAKSASESKDDTKTAGIPAPTVN